MSYDRMEKRAAELEAEVQRWLSAAAAADAEEDKTFGANKSGEELPDWVANKKKRAEKIRAAKAELEAEAKAAAAAKAKARRRPRSGGKPRAARNPDDPPPRHPTSPTPKRRRTSPTPKAAS